MQAPPHTIRTAKRLRAQLSPPEVLLWSRLRALKPQGLHFRRQHPLGPDVLDFYCAKARLAVEVDGIAHTMGDRPQRDERRDAWLAAQGVKVVRIPARTVLGGLDEVVQGLFRASEAPAPHGPPTVSALARRSTSPTGRGGGLKVTRSGRRDRRASLRRC